MTVVTTISRAAKYAVMAVVLYKIKWGLKIAWMGLQVVSYIAPKLIFYGGVALLSL